MTSQISRASLGGKEVVQTNWMQRIGLFILFLACGLAIFLFGSNYFAVFPTNKNLTYNLTLSALTLVVAVWFKFDQRWNMYWQIAFAFFVASVAFPVTSLLGEWKSTVMGWFDLTTLTSQGIAIDKACEVLFIIISLLVLTKLSGADLGSIFIRRGNLKMGLGIGGLVFLFLATASFMFAATRFSSMKLLGDAVVWGLAFSAANSLMEELWLRGIFLNHFAPLLGVGGSVWLTSIIFALMHGFVFYFDPTALIFFVLNTLALGLACGYLMMKSGSIWGAVLIHAASDCYLFIAVLANV